MQYRDVIPVAGEPVPPGTMCSRNGFDWQTRPAGGFTDDDVAYHLFGMKYRCPVPDPLIAALQAENARLRAALKKIVDMESQTHIPSGQRFWTATTIADDALRVSPSSTAASRSLAQGVEP